MLGSEASISNKELRRAKIRERYSAVDNELLEVIPGKKVADFYDDVKRRVAVYVRVSTDSLQQTSSYELQKNYYEEKVSKNSNWTLVDIYADEGISGTSLQHRDAFNRMIEDCKAGKIDMIITKSVSRFARNIVDCISIVRQLTALKNPVAVMFETENIFTLNDNTEMSLSFTATMAQEESHIKSSIMNASIEMRFGRGIVLTPVLLGYDHDEDGKLTINEKEAKTVRLIFFMYLCGYSCQDIANALTELGRETKKGNTTWSAGSILEILRNERHCGEILTRKTYTPSYLDHKAKKNRGERSQHRWKGEHEPIISKDDFIAVQHLISNAKYGNKGILPELKVVPEGALKGFISINPRWAGFKVEDYIYIAKTVCSETDNDDSTIKIEAKGGEFDFRGFEIAREQFFNSTDKLSITFSIKDLKFSVTCTKKLPDTQYIELLIHPLKKLLIVRAVDSKNKNAIKWLSLNNKGEYVSRAVCGTAFLKTIYEMLGWKDNCKYRVRGIRQQNGEENLLIFSLEETEVYLLKEGKKAINGGAEIAKKSLAVTGKSAIGYPSAWAENFGSNYYRHTQAEELQRMKGKSDWSLAQETTTFSEYHDLNITSRDEAEQNIQKIINDMRMEEKANG